MVSRQVLLLAAAAAIAVAFLSAPASAEVYMVGDGAGWTLNYPSTWTSGKVFRVGDVLMFSYPMGSHTVLEVGAEDYEACNVGHPVNSWSTGTDPVRLDNLGNRWFVCSLPDHCALGMKLTVDVFPAPSPITNTCPAPDKTLSLHRPAHQGSGSRHGSVSPSRGHPHAAGQDRRPGLLRHAALLRAAVVARRQGHLLPPVRHQGGRKQVRRRRQDGRLRTRHLCSPRLRRERGGCAQEADIRRDPEQDVHGGEGYRHGQPVPDHRRRRRHLPLQGRQVRGQEVLPRAHLLHRQGGGHPEERAAGLPEDQAHDPPHLHPRRDGGAPRGRRRRHPQVRGEGRHRLRRRHRAAPRRRARALPLHRQAARRHRQARELQRALPRAQLQRLLLPRPQGPWWLYWLRQRGGAARRRQGRRGGARQGEREERLLLHGQHHAQRHQEQPGHRRGDRRLRERAAVRHRPRRQGAQGCQDPGCVVRAARVQLEQSELSQHGTFLCACVPRRVDRWRGKNRGDMHVCI